MESVFEENKPKCHLGTYDEKVEGMCHHPEREHIQGSCMHITQEDLADLPTMAKFCPCGINCGDNLRLYSVVNFMEPDGLRDFMITDKCWSCGEDVLMRLDQNVCVECQNILGVEY